MNRSRHLAAAKIGFVLCTGLFGALTGCIHRQHGPPRACVSPPPVEASALVGHPGVKIRVESDLYEPLNRSDG